MGEKPEGGEKKNEGAKKSDNITVVLKFDMHCEGCAKKVRKSVKKLDGVESVKTDCSANKLEVTGKVDPTKVKEMVEVKTKKKVELVSPQPNKAAKESAGGGGGGGGEKKSGDKKPAEKKSEGKSEDKKPEEKEKEKPKELPVATVLLKTRVHCEGCAQKISKIVSRCEGVQDVNVDLQKDLITAKGTMNMKDLLPYLNMKLKRTVELAPTKKDEKAGGDKKPKEGGGGGGSEKPKEGGGSGGGSEKKKEGGGGGGSGSEKPKGSGGGDKEEGGGSEKKDASGEAAAASSSKDNTTRIEVNKMEYNPYSYGYNYAYDPRQQQEGYGHQVVEYWHAPDYSQPPQMFSDENPNACSVM